MTVRHRRALCRLHFAEQGGLSEGLYPCNMKFRAALLYKTNPHIRINVALTNPKINLKNVRVNAGNRYLLIF